MSPVRGEGVRKVLRVPSQSSGLRLDRFLESRLGFTRSQVKRLIVSGNVLVNGQMPKKAGVKVSEGDAIDVFIPEPEESELVPLDMDLKVYYEDEYLAVVEKPAGLPVHPACGHQQDTLANVLIARFPTLSWLGGVQRPGIVHRLDKDTSGLMMVAKDEKAHLALTEMLKNREVVKVYIAVCWGVPRFMEGRIEAPIGRHPVDRKKMAVVPKGREAISLYRVFSKTERFSLLLVRILTGRTHQIRVHLHHIGCPIIGDPVYGKKGLDLIHRQALHAAFLAFKHPVTERYIELHSSIPEDMAKLCHNLSLEIPSTCDISGWAAKK